jgi:hypothetical protein
MENIGPEEHLELQAPVPTLPTAAAALSESQVARSYVLSLVTRHLQHTELPAALHTITTHSLNTTHYTLSLHWSLQHTAVHTALRYTALHSTLH